MAKDRLLQRQQAYTDSQSALEVLLDADTFDDAAVDAAKAKVSESRKALSATLELAQGTETSTSEGKEKAELRTKLEFKNYVAATLEQRAVGGAEHEWNTEHDLPPNYFPMFLLEKRENTAIDTVAQEQPWVDRLFAESAAMRLGISFRPVPSGVATFPVTTAGPEGAQRAKSQVAGASTWTVAVTDMKPKRNAARIIYSIEDAARLPGLTDALTRDLRASINDAIDLAVFEGDTGASGTAADITGLRSASNVVEKTLTQSNKINGLETLKVYLELVDGQHARGIGDLRIVSSVAANVLWGGTIVASGVSNQTVAAFLRESGVTWTVREGLEATSTANNTFGAYIGRGRGIDGAGVAAIWEAGQLVIDPYSKSDAGEVALTVNYLWDFGLPRASNFARLKFVS